MNRSHKRYVRLMLACFSVTLLPILALNLQLGRQAMGNTSQVRQASEWQHVTHGVTYAPTLSDTALFKTLRLHDRLPEINCVVFGSSTALGVPAAAFPPPVQAYNFAQTGHGLISAIGEAEWLMAHTDNVKYLVVSLDWSLGFIYAEGEPAVADLAAATAQQQATTHANTIPLLDRVRDALSYPRVASLFDILRQILRAQDSRAVFRQYFLQAVSDDYRCADGSWAKDFDTIYRGTCTGFRFDGSATFANLEPVKDARPLILSATVSSSKYTINLMSRQGEPNPAILRHLAALARQAESKGGKLLLFMPPLLPGMEAAFLQHPQLSATLAHSKDALRAWATRENMVILDAGQSERFGCNAAEFADEHHAFPTCYAKVFAAFWNTHARTDGGSIAWPSGGLY
ncbi:MAG: hypothetical protein KGL01_08290 [Betaproteobacteria bacterium]|nr:hypothetical protein [Betaproteobacteria bacterium]